MATSVSPAWRCLSLQMAEDGQVSAAGGGGALGTGFQRSSTRQPSGPGCRLAPNVRCSALTLPHSTPAWLISASWRACFLISLLFFLFWIFQYLFCPFYLFSSMKSYWMNFGGFLVYSSHFLIFPPILSVPFSCFYLQSRIFYSAGNYFYLISSAL